MNKKKKMDIPLQILDYIYPGLSKASSIIFALICVPDRHHSLCGAVCPKGKG